MLEEILIIAIFAVGLMFVLMIGLYIVHMVTEKMMEIPPEEKRGKDENQTEDRNDI